MAGNVHLIRYGSKVGVFPDVTELPNQATATAQTDTLNEGDQAWVDGGVTPGLYACIDPTLGSAQWVLVRRAPSGNLIALDNTLGSGNANWQYAMGSEFRIIQPADITEMHIKTGAGGVGVQHAWELRRSTVVGPTQPALNTYTVVVDGGTHLQTAPEWEAVGMAGPVAATPDQWYVAMFYVFGGGQSANIATMRNQGFLDERFALLNAGVYVFLGVAAPGSVAPPTFRTNTTVYGIASVTIEAP